MALKRPAMQTMRRIEARYWPVDVLPTTAFLVLHLCACGHECSEQRPFGSRIPCLHECQMRRAA